uniref:CWF19-like protein 2 n=1 Tax=Cacopsylla melanoneura TaxID=428564 RepID=A0A8D9A9D9_9HEMI
MRIAGLRRAKRLPTSGTNMKRNRMPQNARKPTTPTLTTNPPAMLYGNIRKQHRYYLPALTVLEVTLSMLLSRYTTTLKMSTYLISFVTGDTKHAPILVDHYTEDVYLALPSTEPLTEHHCLIVTKEHIPGLRQTEPNVYNSVRSLCEKLVGLFSRRGKTCVFFETVSSLKRNHCRVHCVPMDREIGDDAPLYFQKSITDLETDTRHNRTLVKIARNALCRSIPAELEYFYVNFDWQEGFSHLIESKMSPTFAEEIIGGMLDLSSSRWRNPTRLSYETQMKLKLDFLRLYNS